jgi:Cu2+-containing amine oxidase
MPSIEQSNWRVTYYWSASSGLRLGSCDYQATRVIHDASVPFVYVNYAGNAFGPFTDLLKSTSGDVEVREIMRGFDLKVTYDWYGADYQYDHVWRFHHDGQFGSTIVIQGPGEEIGGRHLYHIPFRYDLDLSGASEDSFQTWLSPGGWSDVAQEGRATPVASAAAHSGWRLVDKGSDKSALVRARAADDAELWALRYKPLESWSSWGATGAAPPGAPGSVPAIYDNDESVQHTDIVLWYIAHVSSLDRVTACGPWFALEGFPEPEEPDGHEHDH